MNTMLKKKLYDLEEVLEIEYEKLKEFRKELVIEANIKAKFEIKQRIKRDIIPEIRKYETEYAEILLGEIDSFKISEDYATYLLNEFQQGIIRINNKVSQEDYPEEFIELLKKAQNKLNQPSISAKGKLKASLTIIPGILAYDLEMDPKNLIKSIWQKIKGITNINNIL